MPIVLPKCPTGYELNKDNCRCKKISVTKKRHLRNQKRKSIKQLRKKKVKCDTAKKRDV